MIFARPMPGVVDRSALADHLEGLVQPELCSFQVDRELLRERWQAAASFLMESSPGAIDDRLLHLAAGYLLADAGLRDAALAFFLRSGWKTGTARSVIEATGTGFRTCHFLQQGFLRKAGDAVGREDGWVMDLTGALMNSAICTVTELHLLLGMNLFSRHLENLWDRSSGRGVLRILFPRSLGPRETGEMLGFMRELLNRVAQSRGWTCVPHVVRSL